MNQRAEPLPQSPSSEEGRRRLEAVEREITEIGERAAQARRSLQRVCAEQVGAAEERDPNRLVWHGIVAFANSDPHDDVGFWKAATIYRLLLVLCEIRFPDLFHVMDPMESLSFRDLDYETRKGKTEGEALGRRAYDLHAQFKVMVAWLANPKACTAEQREQSLDFLLKHGEEWQVYSDMDVNQNFDKDGNNSGAPFYYWKSVSGYDTIMTPVARFILDRLERYHEGQLKLEEAVPIIRCRRTECGRFVVPRRTTREFCSNSCRTLYRQKAEPEAWATYMRDYRQKYYKKS
ncbi:MAG: hypothetical protein LAO56_02130 [Acidobacteriia bacterium]|nr:hypothetical protein [Terriglobia bacterium]